MNNKEFFKYCFGCSPESLPKTVIITPFIPVAKFLEYCKAKESFKGRLYSGAIASKGGMEFAVINCGMGDRFMGDAVLLMKDSPVQRIIFAGACGGLADADMGDLIICEKAFNGEGFTRYHMPDFNINEIFNSGELIPADPEYVRGLKDFAHKRIGEKIELKTGNVFTIGSFLAEKKETLLNIEKQAFKGIDMELSAVYHAARVIYRKAAGVVFVSDLPLKKPIWERFTAEEKEHIQTSMRQLIKLSIEFSSFGVK
jgi:purine-nucleoside phosphorylase